MVKYEYRKLERDGKCICCGKQILNHTDNVIRFSAHKSQVGEVTICTDCISEMYLLINGQYEVFENLTEEKKNNIINKIKEWMRNE